MTSSRSEPQASTNPAAAKSSKSFNTFQTVRVVEGFKNATDFREPLAGSRNGTRCSVIQIVLAEEIVEEREAALEQLSEIDVPRGVPHVLKN